MTITEQSGTRDGRTGRGRGGPIDRSITELLQQYGKADDRAMNMLVRKVGPELDRLAHFYLRKERSNHTLDPQSLVHETYLRLATQHKVLWMNRQHFYGVAAQTMRRILCDYARQRNSLKRGGPGQKRLVSIHELDAELIRSESRDPDLHLSIQLALGRLASRDPAAAELVKLRYFAGFTLVEVSEILEIPTRTLSRKWRFARAWLFRELNINK